MTHQYKVGDRVKLVTNGSYPHYKPGMEGTVVGKSRHVGDVVEVAVDGDARYPEGLNFYLREITPLVTDELSDVGIFFLIRQKKDDPSKVKVCWAESTVSRMFTSRERAEIVANRQNLNYPEWNYFVVAKESV